jgi:hypothetical protein
MDRTVTVVWADGCSGSVRMSKQRLAGRQEEVVGKDGRGPAQRSRACGKERSESIVSNFGVSQIYPGLDFAFVLAKYTFTHSSASVSLFSQVGRLIAIHGEPDQNGRFRSKRLGRDHRPGSPEAASAAGASILASCLCTVAPLVFAPSNPLAAGNDEGVYCLWYSRKEALHSSLPLFTTSFQTSVRTSFHLIPLHSSSRFSSFD